MKTNNEQMEKDEIQTAINEINFLIQVLQDVPITNAITRDIQKRFIIDLYKEQKDYVEYLYSTFLEEEETEKKINEMIDCEIEASKIKRSDGEY